MVRARRYNNVTFVRVQMRMRILIALHLHNSYQEATSPEEKHAPSRRYAKPASR